MFILLNLALPPTITEEPAPFTKAVVTSIVTLTCRVFGAPKPEVKWYKEGQILSGGRYQVINYTLCKIFTTVLESAWFSPLQYFHTNKIF